MGEVIKKLFSFYYFLFHQPYAPAMPKNQNQKIRSEVNKRQNQKTNIFFKIYVIQACTYEGQFCIQLTAPNLLF